MAVAQVKVNRQRIFRWLAANIAAAPTDGAQNTNGQYNMSPKTTTGLITTGILLGLKAPTNVTAATAVAAGFSVIMWVLNPVTLAWFAATPVSVPYNQAFTTFDLDASTLYFQVDPASVSVAGSIDFHLTEQ